MAARSAVSGREIARLPTIEKTAITAVLTMMLNIRNWSGDQAPCDRAPIQ